MFLFCWNNLFWASVNIGFSFLVVVYFWGCLCGWDFCRVLFIFRMLFGFKCGFFVFIIIGFKVFCFCIEYSFFIIFFVVIFFYWFKEEF